MERKIGEIFGYNGEWYQCVGGTCRNCSFYYDTVCKNITTIGSTNFGNCHCSLRTDHKSVIFKKLEKVGEPYVAYGKVRQKYKLHAPLTITNGIIDKDISCDDVNGIVDIEIKQDKEDMEENGNNRTNCAQCGDKRFEVIARAKTHLLEATNIASDEKEMAVIDNILFRFYQMGWLERYEEETKELDLKPFDIQKAREGKPVCTRDGRKARIICFDYNGETGDYPIVALVHYNKGNKCYERVLKYTSDGLSNKYGDCQHNDDLMMLPEKRSGWAVIRRSDIYETEEQAKEVLLNSRVGVMIRKIEWEE